MPQERPLLRILTPTGGQFRWLDHGRAGNLQTAAEMASLVREDAMRDEGLTRFAAQLLINSGLDSHSDSDAILDRVFRYVQTISYIHDPGGAFDSINSARETIAKGYGDCDDLAVLLGTLLACLGYSPAFTLAKYADDTNGFDHIYVEIDSEGQSAKGKARIALDPTSRTHGIGWENPRFIDRVTFPIFGNEGAILAGLGQGEEQLAQMGLQLLSGLFSHGPKSTQNDQRLAEAARDAWKIEVHDAMLQVQAAIDACQITADEGVQAARAIVAKFYQSCDVGLTEKIAKSCRNYGSEAGGFDAQIAALTNRKPVCALAPVAASNVSGGTVTAGDVGGLGGLFSSPAVLVLGAGLIFLALKG